MGAGVSRVQAAFAPPSSQAVQSLYSSQSLYSRCPAEISAPIAYKDNAHIEIRGQAYVGDIILTYRIELDSEFDPNCLCPRISAIILRSNLQPTTLAAISAIVGKFPDDFPLKSWSTIRGTDDHVRVVDQFGITVTRFESPTVINTSIIDRFPG